MHLSSKGSRAFLGLKMICQKKYFIIINRFYKNLPLSIKQNFCEATQRLCRGPESRTRTYAAPCRTHFWQLYLMLGMIWTLWNNFLLCGSQPLGYYHEYLLKLVPLLAWIIIESSKYCLLLALLRIYLSINIA